MIMLQLCFMLGQLQVPDDGRQQMKFFFVDRGCHWCKGCKNVYENIHDYIAHLQTYKHKQVHCPTLTYFSQKHPKEYLASSADPDQICGI